MEDPLGESGCRIGVCAGKSSFESSGRYPVIYAGTVADHKRSGALRMQYGMPVVVVLLCICSIQQVYDIREDHDDPSRVFSESGIGVFYDLTADPFADPTDPESVPFAKKTSIYHYCSRNPQFSSRGDGTWDFDEDAWIWNRKTDKLLYEEVSVA